MKVQSSAALRATPYLTLNGVVKIMSSSDATVRESLVRDYKYPDPEGNAQKGYYRPARKIISDYHRSGNDRSVYDGLVNDLQAAAKGASQQKVAKVENNLRAVTSYMNFRASVPYVPLEADEITFDCEGVTLRLRPDFAALERKRLRIIRDDFSQKGSSDSEIRCSLQLLGLYGRNAGINVKNQDCPLIIVSNAEVRTLNGTSIRFEPKLKAAMRDVRRIWADI